MRRGVIGGLIVGATLFAAPALASADTTYCVPSTGIAGCPAGAVAKGTISDALTAVNANAPTDHDTIRIGAKQAPYVEDNLNENPGHRVDIIGAGPTQTVIERSAGTGQTTFSLGDSNSTLSHVSILLATGSGNYGLYCNGTCQDIAVTGQGNGTGVSLAHGGTFSGSVTLPFGMDTTGVYDPTSDPETTIQDAAITADTGVVDVRFVKRTRINAQRGFFVPNASPVYTFDDDLIATVSRGLLETGLSLQANANNTPSASMRLRHVTIVGDGAANSIGVDLGGTAASLTPESVSATADSSIIRSYAHAARLTATAGSNPGETASASLSSDYSDYDPASVQKNPVQGACGSSCASTSLTRGAHDVNVDPQLANTNFSDPQGYHLLATSPVLYSGNPTLASGESTTDADGKPRVVTAPNGASATGMGAFQHQPTAPTASASANPSSAAVGAPITFTGSASDPNPGDAFTYSWAFDDGTSASGPTVSHSFATTGSHTATLTVRDLDNLTGTASTTVTITSSKASGGIISHESLSPSSFRAAPSGPAVQTARAKKKRRKPGTVISYLDSKAGLTTFTVQRPAPGRMRGKTCVKLTKKNSKKPKGRRCTLYVVVGSFTHLDRAGANKFRFSGRIKGHQLAPGNYRLQTSPPNNGRLVFKSFRVIR